MKNNTNNTKDSTPQSNEEVKATEEQLKVDAADTAVAEADQESVAPAIDRSKLLDYQVRVLEERDELEARLGKLVEFNGSTKRAELPDKEQILLVRQEQVMSTYLRVLNERIQLFHIV